MAANTSSPTAARVAATASDGPAYSITGDTSAHSSADVMLHGEGRAGDDTVNI